MIKLLEVLLLLLTTVYHTILSDLETTLQAFAVNISLNKTITVCSVYLPPSSPIDMKKLDHLINQLPKPFILMGDFNSHHTLWGCTDINDKGRTIEGFINEHDLVLLNDKTSTYLHPATGSYSSPPSRTGVEFAGCRPAEW